MVIHARSASVRHRRGRVRPPGTVGCKRSARDARHRVERCLDGDAALDAPANALTTTLRYSGTFITAANRDRAAPLTGSLPGTANVFTATVPILAA